MVHMGSRRSSPWLLVACLIAACVPEPAARATPSPGEATARPTPVVTPAGPTPTPSFVRPTPKPQPTFFVYTVISGDTLVGIARKFGTSGRSIAYWNRVTYPSLDPESARYKPDRLDIGWMLRLIPNREVDPENLPPGPDDTPAPSAAIVG